MQCKTAAVLCLIISAFGDPAASQEYGKPDVVRFELVEADIADLHRAIRRGETSVTAVVRSYLARIRAFNGTCVLEPHGILGRIETIPSAGRINALSTLNLRPETRRALGFDARRARSMTDAADDDPAMPDALEVAAELDRRFAETGELTGPLHGVVIAVKDQYDTFDMRTTSGADAQYANDRPPDDATIIRRMRDAGAVILAKANMGEYASGDRSAFGGTFCNPYDTERSPGRSSGGSGSAVAANLVMCAIAEESGPSARNPAKNNNVVALSPTQELISRDGMIPASFMNDRVGPICRSVEDVARITEVIAGYDASDALTAFSVGRLPAEGYSDFARNAELAGVRVGVVREYMNRELFTAADAQSISLVEAALEDLRALGATVVDPGPGGHLFQGCVDELAPAVHNSLFIAQHPEIFPVDASGEPTEDHIGTLVDLYLNPAAVQSGASIRGLGAAPTTGERKYMLNRYLAERGDARIRSIDDLLDHSVFYEDVRPGSGFRDKKRMLENTNTDLTLDIGARLQNRFSLQQIVMQCMAVLDLDAVTFPTSNIPAARLGDPVEPSRNGRPANAWSLLGANGFPAITVPAGFTSEVYDRRYSEAAGQAEEPELVGPIPARLPVGIDFLARPFDEPTLFAIASAYESVTQHREVPQGYGPLE